MLQSTLFDFWKKPEPPPVAIPKRPTGSAKTILEPLFLRETPDLPKYTERLEVEYALIDRNQFAQVFVQVKIILELIDTLSEETGRPIPHIIRGSAGSSLVCYLLGITHIDPIQYGIELARFMNTNRTDMPDIDIDVPYNRREEIYARISATWPGMVARISNHVKYSSKVALRESIKEVLLQADEPNKKALGALRRRNFKIEAILPNRDEQKAVRETASKKVGTLKNYSKHCGGIVVFDEQGKVPEEIFLKTIESRGQPLAQICLNKDETEAAGFIKIDVLSNRGLAQLAEICPDRPLTAYPRRDVATERILAKGLTIGVTFAESRGMRKLFVEMEPQNVLEVAVGLALIRPAAAAEGRKQDFIDRWKRLTAGAASAEAGNRGIMRPIVFDDDAILKIKRCLGCDAAEADKWRKVFAKNNKEGKLAFIGAMSAAGHDSGTIQMVVDDLNQLMYYSFCKSHAISYAQLVWALAYWRAHRPEAFWCAALNHCHSEYRKWVHYREARCARVLLTRQPPPYTLGRRGGEVCLSGLQPEQALLVEEETADQAVRDMKQLGYWLTKDFLPGCGLWEDSQKRLDGRVRVRFRGPIATGRVVNRNGTTYSLFCIGIGNSQYLDLVVSGSGRHELFNWSILEGEGILKESRSKLLQSVEVEKLRGVSLSKLLESKL
jgi:DNA polymerase III alpha subunit